MSIVNEIFGSDLATLKLENIKHFFKSEKEESDVLEFKSFYEKNQSNYKHKENGILKTICGFLNSNGGLLIWGAPVGKKIETQKEKIFIGDLSPVEKNLEKDSFITKISNRLIPSPSGIKFHKIKYSENQYIYLIEVPKSITKPHQFDDRYLMRLDGQTITAPHHYIEALFKQIQYPNVGGYIKFEKFDESIKNSYNLTIKAILDNHSPLINEEKISIRITLKGGFFYDSFQNSIKDERINYFMSGQQVSINNLVDVLHYGALPFHDEKIILPQKELIKNNNELHITFMFGGKKSPMRVSEYKMKIPPQLPSKTVDMVYSTKENVIMHDWINQEGGDEYRVDRYLDRM